MAIINRKLNLLFVMTPRTACTAIGSALREQLNGEYLPGSDVVDADGRFKLQRKHNSVRELVDYGVLSNEDAAKLFKFATVRNPFDNLSSFYEKKKTKYQPLLADPDAWIHKVPGYVDDMHFCREHTFEQWIVKKFAQSSLRKLFKRRRRNLSKRYTDGVDFVMRFERLQDDFDEALRRAGVKQQIEIPRINTTSEKKKHYREYYTPKARKIVEFAFAEELKQYGYFF